MASVLRFLGPNARLYRNAGTYASPTWTRITLRRSIGVRSGTVETDVTAEDSAGEEEFQQVLNSRSLDVEMVVKDAPAADTNYVALNDAKEAHTMTEFAVAYGDITVNGVRYRRLQCQIGDWQEEIGHKNEMTVKFTAKKCPGEAPTTVTVGS